MSYIYLYIYDVGSLRVDDLTLILLTWRKWTPNNASKWQMELNSAFKGLKSNCITSPPTHRYFSAFLGLRFSSQSVCLFVTLSFTCYMSCVLPVFISLTFDEQWKLWSSCSATSLGFLLIFLFVFVSFRLLAVKSVATTCNALLISGLL
jgi:hypothetical protein